MGFIMLSVSSCTPGNEPSLSVDEEMRALLLRRRAGSATSAAALTTGEGIIAGLVAGKLDPPRRANDRIHYYPNNQPNLDCSDCPIYSSRHIRYILRRQGQKDQANRHRSR
jgi:hypothetical protein